MPKLRPETQVLRRDHILDAAELCFARAGFHRTTMQDICKEAEVSPGALYVYFDSKEALISGLCERDRAQFSARIAELATAPDFLSALKSIGTYYFAEEPPHKRLFVAEMAVESTRNPRIAEIYRAVDAHCIDSFERLFVSLAAAGRIAPHVDARTVARVLNLVGEGVMWRRAVHPDFAFEDVRDTLFGMIERLLNPKIVPPSKLAPSPDTPARTPAEVAS